jgi:hypothetical protein
MRFVVTDGRCVLLSTADLAEAVALSRTSAGELAIVAGAASIATLARFLDAHESNQEASLRRSTWKDAGFKRSPNCTYCRRRVSRESMTVDHFIPLSRGGADDPDNWRLCCHNCNQLKADRLPDELLAWLAGNLGVAMVAEPSEAAA